MPEITLDKLLHGLNDAQRDAVLHGATGESHQGPLIVLAGPGTGKTRVITHRVARVIHDGADPECVLALTFTNKAAAQLRERLATLVGGPTSARVRAQTFHALGLSLIRRFASDLGIPAVRPDAAILDSAQRIRLIRDAINSQNLFSARRAEGIDAVAEIVQTAIKSLGARAIEPERCIEFAELWRTRNNRGQDSAGRDIDAAELKAESARLEEFGDIARAYTWYARECRRRGWLGFDDLIILSIRLLREVPRAAAILRSEFRHAVVDEFQDVNAGQIELLRHLFPPAAPGAMGLTPPGPDLCVVGDDDQSIYGFRGADDRAFAHFDAHWPGNRRILLTENYRSEPAVIAAANRVISLAAYRFAPDKQVVRARHIAGEPAPAGAGVECIELTRDTEDGPAIASAILLDRAKVERPRPWSDYAVVCRSNSDIARIVADLEIEGVPARGSYGEDLSEDPGIQDVLAWIALLVNAREQWPVRRLLTRPPLSVDPLAAMEREKQFRKVVHLAEERGEEPPAYLHWLVQTASGDPVVGASVQRLADLHRRLSVFAASSPAPDTIEQIIVQTDVAHADLLPSGPRARRITALVSFLRLARSILHKLDQPRDLREFLRYWNDLDDEDRSLRDVSSLDERVGHNDDSAGDVESVAAVSVISAHKAKGLEWDTVFVPRVCPPHGYPKTSSGGSSDVLPAGLCGEPGSGNVSQVLEERRVFYVACTRAARRLVMLAKRNKNPSGSTHYFEEFTRDPVGQQLVTIRPIADLRRDAAAALGREEPVRAALESDMDLGGDALERARMNARLAAAEALEAAGHEGAGAEGVAAATARLQRVAAQLAIVSHVSAHRAVPDWCSGDATLSAYAANLVSAVARREAAQVEVPRPPLELSFTAVDAYTRCPACYWLRYVKHLPEAQRIQSLHGTLVHKSLEIFYGLTREAESLGRPAPPLSTLLQIGRAQFASAWRDGADPDPSDLDRTLAQLSVAHERLHDPASQILELEKTVKWDYPVPSEDPSGPPTVHRFTAKLDRIEQYNRPDGTPAYRIVDYKTGEDWKKLTDPAADDLQFGIYALALPHLLDGVDPADVTAEYWLLSTGARGVLPFAGLRLDKVEKKIHGAVRGILAGRFERDSDCNGDCRILRASFGGG